MTPMIDVTFLLLTFFMLASHFASAEKTDVDLPQPDQSQAVDRRLTDKIIINALYEADLTEASLQLGPMPVKSMTELADRLTKMARSNSQAQVILRADRRLGYGQVRRIMEAVVSAGLTRLQVVTELDEQQ